MSVRTHSTYVRTYVCVCACAQDCVAVCMRWPALPSRLPCLVLVPMAGMSTMPHVLAAFCLRRHGAAIKRILSDWYGPYYRCESCNECKVRAFDHCWPECENCFFERCHSVHSWHPFPAATRLDSTRLDSIRLDSIRLDSTRLDSTRLDSARLDSLGEDKARQDERRQGKARQDKAMI